MVINKKTQKPSESKNNITGKTIEEMTWDDMRKIAKPISREDAIRKMKGTK